MPGLAAAVSATCSARLAFCCQSRGPGVDLGAFALSHCEGSLLEIPRVKCEFFFVCGFKGNKVDTSFFGSC